MAEEARGTDAVCALVAEGQDGHYHEMCMNIIMELLAHVPTKQDAAVIAESTILYVIVAFGLNPDTGLDTMMQAVRDRIKEIPEGETIQ